LHADSGALAATLPGMPARLGDGTPEADLALGQAADADER
jgi:hypothetical protein